MFASSSLSCENYSLTLKGWAENTNTPSNVNFSDQLGMRYANTTIPYRNALLAKGWTITNDGAAIPGSTCYNMILPVHFGAVAATIGSKGLLVNWQTLTEVNNSRFEIEASKDGKNFTKIGEVATQATDGNSSNVLDYRFAKDATDAAELGGWLLLPLALILLVTNKKRTKAAGKLVAVLGMVLLGFSACSKGDAVNKDSEGGSLYIRIKQIDKDGGFQYSKTVKAVNQ